MQIKVLPYIDTSRSDPKAAQAPASRTPQTAADTLSAFTRTNRSGSAENTLQTERKAAGMSFQMTLATAQRTLEALTVDLIASQDPETIEKAAEILAASGSTQLQKLGQSLIRTDAGTGVPVSPDGAAADRPTTGSTDTLASGSADAATGSSPSAGTADTSSGAGADSASASSSAAERSDSQTERPAASSVGGTVSEAARKAASTLGCPSYLEPYFEEASEKYGVDIALLEAIAKAESDFTTDAVSSAGATGVMQLMPETAEELGVTDLYDARSNISGGAKEISNYLKNYNGNLSLSLAAYNAGPGNVRKYGGIPPFKETQTYIKRVTDYYNSAKAL